MITIDITGKYAAPVFYCDACNEIIENHKDGYALFSGHKASEKPLFIHRTCENKATRAMRWMILRDSSLYLACNIKALDIKDHHVQGSFSPWAFMEL